MRERVKWKTLLYMSIKEHVQQRYDYIHRFTLTLSFATSFVFHFLRIIHFIVNKEIISSPALVWKQ